VGTKKRGEAPQPAESVNPVLERAKAEWEAAFDSISEGIAITDTDGKIRRVNRAMAMLLGKDIRRITGLACCDVMQHHRAYPEACPVRNYPDGKKGVYEVFFPEYRYHEERVSPIVKAGRKLGFVLTVRDITAEQMASEERKHLYLQIDEAVRKGKVADQRLADLRAELTRAEHAAILGRLAGSVLAEVERSVRMIDEGLSYLAGKPEKGQAKNGAASVMADLRVAASRARTTVGHLASLRATDADSVDLVRADKVVKEVVEAMRGEAARQGTKLEVSAPAPFMFEGNRSQVATMLTCLVLNAIEASRGSAKEPVRVAVSRRKGHVCIEVTDSGRGIEAAYLSEIFNPFFTTDSQGAKVGLGLTVCQAIVDGHHGHIEVDSAPAKGTTIRVLLPAPED